VRCCISRNPCQSKTTLSRLDAARAETAGGALEAQAVIRRAVSVAVDMSVRAAAVVDPDRSRASSSVARHHDVLRREIRSRNN
jgi:hypothetical protein